MKSNKILALLLILALVASIGLTACGGDDTSDEPQTGEDTNDSGSDELADEQILRVNWGEEPPNLDPQLSQDAVSSQILIDTLEGIVRLNENGEPEEGLGMAESWEISEDGKKYIFNLRDAKWSDGEPVTAQDFEYSWKRALAPKTASVYAFLAYAIENAEEYNTGDLDNADEVGVKATDDKTLEVTLKQPDPTFLSKLQNSTFLPTREDKVEEWGDKYGSDVEYMVFNGPFVISEWEHEAHLNLEKNEDYWNKDVVKLDKIEGTMVTDPNTIINLYETGELDVATVPSQFIDKYKEQIIPVPRASVYYVKFNAENEFFGNAKIRRAMSMALDRTKIQNARTKGITPPAFGFVPPGMPGSEGKTFREQNGDVMKDIGNGATAEEAKKLFEEGLEEIGKTVEDMNGIKLLNFDSENALQTAQIWQQYWNETLGLEVEIDQATFKIKIQREDDKDYAFSYAGWIGDYNDPMTFMDMWVSDSTVNTANWKNEEYDALIKTANTTTGEERMQALLDAEKLLLEEMPIAPVSYAVERKLQNDKVHGIIRLPLQVEEGLIKAYITK